MRNGSIMVEVYAHYQHCEVGGVFHQISQYPDKISSIRCHHRSFLMLLVMRCKFHLNWINFDGVMSADMCVDGAVFAAVSLVCFRAPPDLLFAFCSAVLDLQALPAVVQKPWVSFAAFRPSSVHSSRYGQDTACCELLCLSQLACASRLGFSGA